MPTARATVLAFLGCQSWHENRLRRDKRLATDHALRVYDQGNNTRVSFQNGGNVGIGTTAPNARLHVDAGQNTTVLIESDDNGASTLNLYGNNQGTGPRIRGQSATYGGGIEYNGDNNPITTGAGADFVTLFRRDAGTDAWTARNRYNNNNWSSEEIFTRKGGSVVGTNAPSQALEVRGHALNRGPAWAATGDKLFSIWAMATTVFAANTLQGFTLFYSRGC